jgi:hypothetical protein
MGVPIVGDVIGAFTSLFGESEAKKQRQKAEQRLDEAFGQAKNQYALDPTKSLDFLGLTNRSAYQDMNPYARNVSNEALGQLLKRGSGTGLDIQSREALQQGIGQAGGAARAARQAVLQDYQQKGTGGSSAELAAALGGTQQVYGDLANASGQAAAAAEQRRLEANVLASRAGQQQQAVDQNTAAAQDALRRFNVGARQNTLTNQMQAVNNMGAIANNQANNQMEQSNQTVSSWGRQGNAWNNVAQDLMPKLPGMGA